MISPYVQIHLNNGEAKLYAQNSTSLDLELNTSVIITFTKDDFLYEDNAKVIEFAENAIVDESSDIYKLEVLRSVTPHDLQIIDTHKKTAKEAMGVSIDLVKKHNLDMKIIEAKISHDNKVLTLVFTAEERVDFRELLKDLAKNFKRQIRLRQIGPRDHAKILGGFGKCGREQCCSAFLKDLGGITMEMARVQDITSKGAAKISGNCGKLLCCLAYELEVYKSLRENMPRIGDMVKTKEGVGQVIDLEVLKQLVKVAIEVKIEKSARREESYQEKIMTFGLEEITLKK